LEITFFGTSAASPSVQRGFACVGVKQEDEFILLDCGDGSIRNVLKFGGDVMKISGILITHYHSDHLSGLTQIIESMGIRKRTTPLSVYGLPGLKEYFSTVEKTTFVAFKRKFSIDLKEIGSNQEFTLGTFGVSTFEMDHTIPCIGYRVSSRGRTVSYTGDTMPCSAAISLGRNSDLFIHEATFLKKDFEKAKETKHSSPSEAAQEAKEARAKKLILTHVNEDHENPAQMMQEAEGIFEDLSVAYDGMKIQL
jgi:ribonuclease Z